MAGIDIVCQDSAQPLAEQRGAVIEVNAAPGIRMHQYPSAGEPRDAGEAIVDGLMGKSDGRIPIIAGITAWQDIHTMPNSIPPRRVDHWPRAIHHRNRTGVR